MAKKRSGHGKYSKSDQELTPCICPRCGCEHEMKLFWVGKLPAKKHCKPCRGFRGKNSSSLDKGSARVASSPGKGIGSD